MKKELILFSIFCMSIFSNAQPLKQEIVFLTASELSKKIANKELSSEEVVKAHIEHIKKYNPKINAIVNLNEKEALLQAKKADEDIKKGKLQGLLHGVPITIKDNLAVKNLRITSGYKPNKDFIAKKDATLVKKLKDEGAIILGITNMPSLGLDAQTFNDLYGRTNNPWDLSRTPGGSSGGCSAAVAAGFTPISIGNDIGGSLRVPAHSTGVYTIKPTDHLVSKTGLLPEEKEFRALRHLISSGPLARSIEDLKLILKIIAGSDNIDTNVPDITLEDKSIDIKNLKVAWSETYGNRYVSSEVKAIFKEFINKLKQKSINLEENSFETLDYEFSREVFFDLFGQEALVHEGKFSRFLLSDKPFNKIFPLSLPQYMKTLTQREELIKQTESFLSSYDVWIIPVSPISAHKHIEPDEKHGPFSIYKNPIINENQEVDVGSLTTLFNLTGNPVVVIPIGFTKDGLPVGIQLVGKRWKDMELLNIVQGLEKSIGDEKISYEKSLKSL